MLMDRAFCDEVVATASDDLRPPFSMLSAQTLAVVHAFAMNSTGPVIEVGTYVGGTSVVLARALGECGGRGLICLEPGGAHDHPDIPSRDILADWRKNIARAGVPRPYLIEDYAWRPAAAEVVADHLAGEKAGLIVIDADGFPGITLVDFAPFLRDDCLVVVDDYTTNAGELEQQKAATGKIQIDSLVERGELETLAVVPFGTWFGRLLRPPSAYRLGLVHASKQGVGWAERVPHRTESWQLFGEAGAYRQAPADEVMRFGDGRYCVATDAGGGFVYFAPQGNSEHLNDRQLELRA
jgi:predicted O-methyltransferase YrrM